MFWLRRCSKVFETRTFRTNTFRAIHYVLNSHMFWTVIHFEQFYVLNSHTFKEFRFVPYIMFWRFLHFEQGCLSTLGKLWLETSTLWTRHVLKNSTFNPLDRFETRPFRTNTLWSVRFGTSTLSSCTEYTVCKINKIYKKEWHPATKPLYKKQY